MICNAKIKDCFIRLNDYDDVEIRLVIDISGKGQCVLSVDPKDIKTLFTVLDIRDIKEVKNSACVALVTDHCIRTIGNFMFWDKSGVYDSEKADHINSLDWLNPDIYLKYKGEK